MNALFLPINVFAIPTVLQNGQESDDMQNVFLSTIDVSTSGGSGLIVDVENLGGLQSLGDSYYLEIGVVLPDGNQNVELDLIFSGITIASFTVSAGTNNLAIIRARIVLCGTNTVRGWFNYEESDDGGNNIISKYGSIGVNDVTTLDTSEVRLQVSNQTDNVDTVCKFARLDFYNGSGSVFGTPVLASEGGGNYQFSWDETYPEASAWFVYQNGVMRSDLPVSIGTPFTWLGNSGDLIQVGGIDQGGNPDTNLSNAIPQP